MNAKKLALCVGWGMLSTVVALLPTVSRTQTFCFETAVEYLIGDGRLEAVAADLDGDGDVDLAVTNVNGDSLVVLENDGNGGFSVAGTYTAGDGPKSVRAVDLDGDGDADLAVANIYSDNVSILKNNGDGTFAAATDYPAGDGPKSVFAADLDGDDDVDLVTANDISDNVSVLKNNGDGTFSSPTHYAAGDGAVSVFATDLDGDTDADLAVANREADNVSVLKNNGDGTFAPAMNYGYGDYFCVVAADLDQDGDADLALPDFYRDRVSVLKNNGNGTFAPSVYYSAPDGPSSICAADLDGDSHLDLAASSYDGGNISVLRNNGNGTFAAAVTYAANDNASQVIAADLDNDSDNDLIVACDWDNIISVLENCLLEPCVLPPADLVCWWPGEGNADDIVSGNHGTLMNGTSFASGKVRQAFSLDGVDDHVLIPSTPDIDVGIHEVRTVECWFYVNDKTISTRKQVIYEEGGTFRGLNIYIFDGRLYVGGYNDPDGGGESYWTGTYLSTSAIQSDVWHHVALVLDGSPTVQPNALSAYLDGDLVGVGEGSQLWDHYSATIGCAESGVQFHDGDDAVASGHWFDGLIDEVSIYNRALAPEEILAIYTAGSAGKCNDLTPNTPPVLNWTAPTEGIPGIAPDTGIADTYFEFAVVYSDSDGHPPSSGYPQVRIDYEGDGLITGPKDAVYTMWPTGAADFVAGRKYIYRTTLPVGATYQFSFAAFDQPGDPAEGEAAWVWVSGPTVQSEPVDLYLYASDITFSNASPSVGDTFFVSATIHNNSSSDFTDVPVDVADKFGPIGTVLLPTLPAYGTATATQGFRYGTDGYYTFRFTVDPGNAITEWDELNNSAVRGVVIGQPVLPGYIRLLAQTTNPNLPWGWATVSGRADYFGPDSLEPVSGATVTIDVEDYRSFVGYTKDNGDFAISFRAPLAVGDYSMNVNVTDFTLSQDTTLTLTVVSCLQSLPDLVCNISLSRTPTIVNLDDTTSISSLYVYNLCEDTAYDFWLHLYEDGVIIDSAGPIAELGPHQTYYPPAWQNLPFEFPEVGYHSISCYADLRNAVSENSEDNNQTTIPFHLWCDRPDFAPQPPFPQPLAYVGQPFTLHARLYNQGGIAIPDTWGVEAADSAAVRFRVTKDTLVLEQTTKHTVEAFGTWTDVSFPLTFPETGQYWVAVTADPAAQIAECNEGNNEIGWWIYVDDPRVNLRIEYEDVTVTDPFANADGQMVNIEAVVHNRGNGTATGVRVLFTVDTDQIGDTVVIPSIAPYSARAATSTSGWPVDRAACVIKATADPANAITESNELDNTGSVPAVFELYPVYWGSCPRWPWPMFGVCASGVNEPVTIYARAQTSGAFSISGLVSVYFEDRDPDGVLIDLGTVMLNGLYHHCQNVRLDSLVYAFDKPGWHFVTATVDAESQYPECDENNSHTDSIWIGLMPDLLVHSEHIDPDPLNPYPGDSVTISVDIYNVGYAVADNVRVAFLMDGVALGDTVTIASIPAPPSHNNYVGIQATQKWPATDTPTGLHVVRVIADADNTIPEEDEDNNEATRAIIVGDAPDLRVNAEGISFSDYYTSVGFPTTISASIHNDGAAAASSHVDIYHVVGSDTVVIASNDLPAISPGDSSLVSAVWIISTDSTDVHVEIASTEPMDFDVENNHARKLFQLLLSGDCNQDRVIDVLDVVYAVDVAFRNGVPPEPLALIDVNCDGVISILDVVKLVNVAFRGGNPATEFCERTPLILSGN